MNIHLLIHNVGFIISAIATIGIGLFLLLNKQRSVSSMAMAYCSITAAVFIISHVIGVSVSDPNVSRDVLMFNLSIFLISMFNVHGVLAYLGKAKTRWFMLALIYSSGLACIMFFIVFPDLFLLPSVPKMYFPNYYNPGILNWVRLAFQFGICLPYMLIELFLAYRASTDSVFKNKAKYFIYTMLGGYGTGCIANFLVYNIPIDPLWANGFGIIFATIVVYGALKYELFDIRIIAKQAFIYGIGIAVVGCAIVLFDYSNRLIDEIYPGFPIWITPLISAFIVVFVAGLVWRRLKENDFMRYEFVTTVTHKFRTPLTHIKWASENLSKTITSEEDKTQVGYIQSAGDKLTELTGLLMNVSGSEDTDYEYRIVKQDLSTLLTELASSLHDQYEIKKVAVSMAIEPGIYVNFDEARTRFVAQTFIENAVHYTPEGGAISISLTTDAKGHAVFSVKDSGIGISKEDLPRLFSKFYRGHDARLADTEGMGIGLYISKQIIARQNGKIWAASDGAGQGSTFNFTLPLSD